MASKIEDYTLPSVSSNTRVDLIPRAERGTLMKNMKQKHSGRRIRNMSIILCIIILPNTAACIGWAATSFKDYVFWAGSSTAKVNFLYATISTIGMPWICKVYLENIAAAAAGQYISEHAYSAKNSFLLVTINLQMNLGFEQYRATFRASEHGVRMVVFTRLVGDYIVNFCVPFVSLALVYQAKEDKCWMGYEWGWLLLALLWPTPWTIAVLVSLKRFWGLPGFTRGAEISGVQAAIQAALYLKLIVQEVTGDLTNVDWCKAEFSKVHGVRPYSGC